MVTITARCLNEVYRARLRAERPTSSIVKQLLAGWRVGRHAGVAVVLRERRTAGPFATALRSLERDESPLILDRSHDEDRRAIGSTPCQAELLLLRLQQERSITDAGR